MTRYAPRFAARKDKSQREVIETLEAMGCSVRVLPSLADSLPDLAVGLMGQLTFFVEVKNPDTVDDFTDQQDEFWQFWRGNPKIVLTDRDSAAAWVQKVRGQE